MPVLSSQQIRAWDEFTMQHEPIASIDLMERAAGRCFRWLDQNNYLPHHFSVFCGKGNNGGDGLALARMLSMQTKVVVYILEFGHLGTDDFQTNLSRLHETDVEIKFVQSEDQLPIIPKEDLIIDALLGSGLNRPVEGFTASMIRHMNESGNEIISIDLPSGLFVDRTSKNNLVVKANHTLTFQCLKPAFMVSENAALVGRVHVLDIGLLPAYLQTMKPIYSWIDQQLISTIYRPRDPYSHKGTYGHALLVAGTYGKMGAAVLCAKACLRSGAGLVSMHIPRCGLEILQTAVPEAMCDPDPNERMNQSIKNDLEKYSTIGIGPGIGTMEETASLLEQIFSTFHHPLVLDADALNIISFRQLHHKIPKRSVLTPHPKEFERLFGSSDNDFARIEKAIERARDLQVTIILKGHHTFIADPEGNGYFNSTGNAGMATGGTGDVLTGLITGLVAQKYSPTEAAILGVYWHGAAGDLATAHISEESLIASDVVDHLGLIDLSGTN